MLSFQEDQSSREFCNEGNTDSGWFSGNNCINRKVKENKLEE